MEQPCVGTFAGARTSVYMRYFFDVLDGVTRSDVQGVELLNDAAAQQEARLRALGNKSSYRLEKYDGEHRTIQVRDETERVICEIPLDE